MTCGWGVKEFLLLLFSHKLIAIDNLCPLLYYNTQNSLPDYSLITHKLLPNHSLVKISSIYPPIFDALECVGLHTGLPISVLLKM